METIKHYFPNLTDTQTQQFEALKPLYDDWNAKINLISRKDMDNFYLHHVLHSLGIAKVLNFVADTHLLDVGTGGGFPTIPLAILLPQVQLTAVDSIGKKIKVVNEVVNALGLKNVKTINDRVENTKGQYDFVVSRAVAQLPEFYRWVQSKIASKDKNALPNGILYLKGSDIEAEIKLLRQEVLIYDLADYFKEAYFKTKIVAYIPF